MKIKIEDFMKDKKGDTTAEDTFHLILLTFALTITALVFVGFLSAASTNKTKIIEGVEETILMQRIMTSPECFLYRDNVNRVYPGIFDISKFTQERFYSCFNNSKNNYEFKVTLFYQESGEEQTTKALKTQNWDEKGVFEQDSPMNILLKSEEKESFMDGKLVVAYQKNY